MATLLPSKEWSTLEHVGWGRRSPQRSGAERINKSGGAEAEEGGDADRNWHQVKQEVALLGARPPLPSTHTHSATFLSLSLPPSFAAAAAALTEGGRERASTEQRHSKEGWGGRAGGSSQSQSGAIILMDFWQKGRYRPGPRCVAIGLSLSCVLPPPGPVQ
jgi:hypothetical protein